MIERTFHGSNAGYIVLVLAGFYLAGAAWLTDYFIDETDSPPMSEDYKERHALKATKVTRPMMSGVGLCIAGFGIWKML